MRIILHYHTFPLSLYEKIENLYGITLPVYHTFPLSSYGIPHWEPLTPMNGNGFSHWWFIPHWEPLTPSALRMVSTLARYPCSSLNLVHLSNLFSTTKMELAYMVFCAPPLHNLLYHPFVRPFTSSITPLSHACGHLITCLMQFLLQ